MSRNIQTQVASSMTSHWLQSEADLIDLAPPLLAVGSDRELNMNPSIIGDLTQKVIQIVGTADISGFQIKLSDWGLSLGRNRECALLSSREEATLLHSLVQICPSCDKFAAIARYAQNTIKRLSLSITPPGVSNTAPLVSAQVVDDNQTAIEQRGDISDLSSFPEYHTPTDESFLNRSGNTITSLTYTSITPLSDCDNPSDSEESELNNYPEVTSHFHTDCLFIPVWQGSKWSSLTPASLMSNSWGADNRDQEAVESREYLPYNRACSDFAKLLGSAAEDSLTQFRAYQSPDTAQSSSSRTPTRDLSPDLSHWESDLAIPERTDLDRVDPERIDLEQADAKYLNLSVSNRFIIPDHMASHAMASHAMASHAMTSHAMTSHAMASHAMTSHAMTSHAMTAVTPPNCASVASRSSSENSSEESDTEPRIFPEVTSISFNPPSYLEELEECEDITQLMRCFPHVKQITLTHPISLDRMKTLLMSCPELTHLCLYWWEELVDDELEQILELCPLLRKLELESCPCLKQFHRIANFCRELTHLTITDNDFVDREKTLLLVCKLPRLVQLDLGECIHIKNSDLDTILRSHNKLTILTSCDNPPPVAKRAAHPLVPKLSA